VARKSTARQRKRKRKRKTTDVAPGAWLPA
jgi:hypothetical protein